MTTTDNTAAATGAAKYPRLTRWAGYFTSVCVILIALVQGLSFFTLPSCDASGIKDTVRSIFQDKKVELEQLTDIKQVSEEKGQTNCAARIQVKGEPLDLTYRVFWDGWSKKVQISDVREVAAASGK